MRRYRLELMLGTVFLAVFLVFYLKVSPGPKLTREEVAAYVPKIEQGLTMPEPDRSEFIARVRAWGEADDRGSGGHGVYGISGDRHAVDSNERGGRGATDSAAHHGGGHDECRGCCLHTSPGPDDGIDRAAGYSGFGWRHFAAVTPVLESKERKGDM